MSLRTSFATLLVAVAQHVKENPTEVATLLREPGHQDSTLWSQSALDALQTGFAELVLRGHESVITSVAFSPDGKKIVTGSKDKTARIWNADGSGASVVLKGHEDSVTSVAFSPDGKKIVSGSKDKTARILNADGSGTPVVLRGHEDAVTSVAFSPDGKKIVTGSGDLFPGSKDETARIWNADGSGAPVVLKGHESFVTSVAFSPDGKKIVTGSNDKTARIWNADGSGASLVLAGHEDAVTSVAFSPDGKKIVTGSGNVFLVNNGDKPARVWMVSSDLLLDVLWNATSECLPERRRQELLGEAPADAKQGYDRCRQEVARRRGWTAH
jgi:WD40 repeat protein